MPDELRPALGQEPAPAQPLLEIFKRGLDRPRAKLPKFKYYLLAFLLGPGMIPYKVAVDLAVLLRSKARGKVMSKVDAMLERFKLRMEPTRGDDKWVRVSTPDNGYEERVLNPTRVSVATIFTAPVPLTFTVVSII